MVNGFHINVLVWINNDATKYQKSIDKKNILIYNVNVADEESSLFTYLLSICACSSAG